MQNYRAVYVQLAVQKTATRPRQKPKPEYAESFVLGKMPTSARTALGPFVQPSPYNFAMPRFAAELKGLNGAIAPDEAQSAYNAAVMTEAAIEQEAYLGNSLAYEKTQAITADFIEGKYVSIHANHAEKTDSNATTYYHHPVLFDDMPVKSKEAYKDTRRHFRNAQDWAREQSEQMLNRIREKTEKPVVLTPVSESKSYVVVEGSRPKRSKSSRR